MLAVGERKKKGGGGGMYAYTKDSKNNSISRFANCPSSPEGLLVKILCIFKSMGI